MNENKKVESNGMLFLGIALTIFGLMVPIYVALSYGMIGGGKYLDAMGSSAVSGAIVINPIIFIVLVLIGMLMIYDHFKGGK